MNFLLELINTLLGVFGLQIVKISSSFNQKRAQRTLDYHRLPTISKASNDGKMTGFEPQILENYFLNQFELMFGEPGKGLSASNFDNKMIQLGQEGELNFAKSLQKKNLLNRLVTFWSVHNLGIGDEKIPADVDCVIVSGNTIWLIDLKLYASGDVIYRSDRKFLYTIDVTTGSLVGKPKKMSHNMKFAQEKFSKKFENLLRYYKLETRVVLMPTKKGAGQIDKVYWPGNIPAITLEDMLLELEQEPPFKDTIGGQMIRQTFSLLLKR
ncbi:nuclease-related domain-containing protein [uncultured Granulicatella sp.]|uniref:nuclease-related domain-containing protein n=1 Tax=uncultured Granulicatella sp. TaxID=316089 RepID=UPI0028D21065|nr:nuclease-related domain-containing protein [uncultured Granulicatella sp.]